LFQNNSFEHFVLFFECFVFSQNKLYLVEHFCFYLDNFLEYCYLFPEQFLLLKEKQDFFI